MKKAGERIQSSINYTRFCRNKKVQQSISKRRQLGTIKKDKRRKIKNSQHFQLTGEVLKKAKVSYLR